MKKFLDQNFLLQNKTAQELYYGYAQEMPVIDYHCHLPPDQIALDINFQNITLQFHPGQWRSRCRVVTKIVMDTTMVFAPQKPLYLLTLNAAASLLLSASLVSVPAGSDLRQRQAAVAAAIA